MRLVRPAGPYPRAALAFRPRRAAVAFDVVVEMRGAQFTVRTLSSVFSRKGGLPEGLWRDDGPSAPSSEASDARTAARPVGRGSSGGWFLVVVTCLSAVFRREN